MRILGVDIGGTGIKAAVVETQTGELISEHKRIPTPQPATPENIASQSGTSGCRLSVVWANWLWFPRHRASWRCLQCQ